MEMVFTTMEYITFGFCWIIYGIYILVVVDFPSNCLDVHIMESMTAEKTIEKPQSIFANLLPRSLGLPK